MVERILKEDENSWFQNESGFEGKNKADEKSVRTFTKVSKQVLMVTYTYRQRGKPRCQQDKLQRIKQVGFAGPISSDDAIGTRRKGMDFRLLLERPKVGKGNLFNVHDMKDWLIPSGITPVSWMGEKVVFRDHFFLESLVVVVPSTYGMVRLWLLCWKLKTKDGEITALFRFTREIALENRSVGRTDTELRLSRTSRILETSVFRGRSLSLCS